MIDSLGGKNSGCVCLLEDRKDFVQHGQEFPRRSRKEDGGLVSVLQELTRCRAIRVWEDPGALEHERLAPVLRRNAPIITPIFLLDRRVQPWTINKRDAERL